MGRIPIENNRFTSRDTETHPSETAMMKGNIILEMDIFVHFSQTFETQDRNWLPSKPQNALNCFKNTLLTHRCPIQILKIIQEGFVWIIVVNV